MYFCVVLSIVCFVSFSVLFVCICVLNYCHRVATQLQLNISYHVSEVFPSIIRSLRLYIQHHTIQVLWMLASKQPQNLYDIYLMLYVQS